MISAIFLQQKSVLDGYNVGGERIQSPGNVSMQCSFANGGMINEVAQRHVHSSFSSGIIRASLRQMTYRLPEKLFVKRTYLF